MAFAVSFATATFDLVRLSFFARFWREDIRNIVNKKDLQEFFLLVAMWRTR